MPIGTTSYLAGSRAFKSEAAEMSETSCSPERPPNKTPRRILLLNKSLSVHAKQRLFCITLRYRENGFRQLHITLKPARHPHVAKIAARVGLAAPSTEDDLRRFVIQKAQSHDIELQPSQIAVRVTGEPKTAVIYLAADYTTRVDLIFYKLTLHFTPASDKRFL